MAKRGIYPTAMEELENLLEDAKDEGCTETNKFKFEKIMEECVKQKIKNIICTDIYTSIKYYFIRHKGWTEKLKEYEKELKNMHQ